MKQNYTHLILVLDESGSMSGLTEATIEGVNSLLLEQNKQPGDLTTALYKFSDTVSDVATFMILTKENYMPHGCTALLDAICHAVDTEGKKLDTLHETQRPDKIVVVIVTDGQENASKTWKLHDVRDRITLQQDSYNWKFVFLGANIDAFAVGGTYGILANSTLQYDPSAAGVRVSYAAVSTSMTSYRAGATADVDLQAKA